ncbi:MAG: Alpha-maltose-1-phosphate synthase [Candidatus Udaeobacter sp.]|jgi:glycosyltransferase involved in cell wall biosynthesis|nr:MAG: Alpha-maltose-1-phosphate synthase [Candidatus Udaeobacter sp.]
MRIAQVAPLIESVPPKHYGGTERIVSYLTEELVRAGHDVTLFGSGDSVTQARLIPGCRQSLRLNKQCVDHLAHHLVMIDRVLEHARDFDVIHFHTDYLHFSASRYLRVPHITTLHGRLDLPDLIPVYDRFRHIPVISISNAQRRPLPSANWVGTIYHGLPQELFRLQPNPGNYLAFLGRICREKRADRAIEIAKRAGMPLKIAAKVDPVDRRYFKRVVEPLLQQSHVEWIGEISDREKNDFLGNAHALLFPIDWPEPFGLVMIEAMACGTPVIAYDGGAVSEVIKEGQTGFIAKNVEDAAEAVHRVPELSRAHCRKVFEKRFTVTRMARDYVKIYKRMIDRRMSGVDRCIESSRREITACRRAFENSKIKDAQLHI